MRTRTDFRQRSRDPKRSSVPNHVCETALKEAAMKMFLYVHFNLSQHKQRKSKSEASCYACVIRTSDRNEEEITRRRRAVKIRGKLRRERCRRPRGKNRTGIEERPHDPTSSALQWRRSRRLRSVRPRSKAAGDVRCTKSIMRVTMATTQPPIDAAQQQFML